MTDSFNHYAGGKPDFAAWLRAVDTLILDALGVGLFDLPDVLLRDMFDAGMTAAEVAGDMIWWTQQAAGDFGTAYNDAIEGRF